MKATEKWTEWPPFGKMFVSIPLEQYLSGPILSLSDSIGTLNGLQNLMLCS